MDHNRFGYLHAVVAVCLCLLSCASQNPVISENAQSRLISDLLPLQPDWVGRRPQGVVLLDSKVGVGSSQGDSVGTKPSVMPLEVVWAKGVKKGVMQSSFYSVANDGAGNIYAVGILVLGSTSYLGDGVSVHGVSLGTNAFIVKYDASGKTLWARSAVEGTASSRFYSVAVDSSGNVYVAGTVEKGPVGFGRNVRVEGKYAGMNLLLVKYDPKGQALWARTLASSDGESEFNSVAVDRSGGIYAAGYFVTETGGPVDFSNRGPRYRVPEKVGGGANALLAKLDTAGSILWVAQTTGNDVSAKYFSVAIDGADNVYACGYASGGTYSFGNGVGVSGPSGTINAILVRYEASGKARWARSLKSAFGNSMFRCMGLDGKGNIYSAGDLDGKERYDFGNGVIAMGSSQKRNPLLVKYDSSGTPHWARSLVKGPGDFDFHTAAVDGKSVYLAGYFRVESNGETYDFGGASPVHPTRFPGYIEFLAAFDFSGTPQWVQVPPLKGLVQAHIRSMLSDGQGKIIVVGEIIGNGVVDLGNGVGVDCIEAYSNLFVAQYRTR